MTVNDVMDLVAAEIREQQEYYARQSPPRNGSREV